MLLSANEFAILVASLFTESKSFCTSNNSAVTLPLSAFCESVISKASNFAIFSVNSVFFLSSVFFLFCSNLITFLSKSCFFDKLLIISKVLACSSPTSLLTATLTSSIILLAFSPIVDCQANASTILAFLPKFPTIPSIAPKVRFCSPTNLSPITYCQYFLFVFHSFARVFISANALSLYSCTFSTPASFHCSSVNVSIAFETLDVISETDEPITSSPLMKANCPDFFASSDFAMFPFKASSFASKANPFILLAVCIFDGKIICCRLLSCQVLAIASLYFNSSASCFI